MSKKRYYPSTPKKGQQTTNKQLATQNKEVRLGRRPPIKDTRESEKIEIDFFHLYESLYRKEIADWQTARAMLYDPFNSSTYHIQQLYKDAMIDLHLQGAINSRILRVANKEIVLKNDKDEIDDLLSKKFQKKWMREVIERAMESKFYGYSLALIYRTNNDKMEVIDLPRENVLPKKGILLKDAMNMTGEQLRFRDFPNHLLYIQLDNSYAGKLESIAPMTIFKRHSWASWDEFEQIFGVPIRIARTAINTKKHRDDIQEWLEAMGSASYAIFDKHTDIEIKENQKNDSFNVFAQKIAMINKEISKGIVGQTMTMDDGSSHSQAEVHLEIYQDITDADIMDMQDWLTDSFIPILNAWGFGIPDGYYFELQEKTIIKPEDKIKVDGVLLQSGVNLTPKYLEDTYGVEIDKENPSRFDMPMLKVDSKTNKTLDITDFFV